MAVLTDVSLTNTARLAGSANHMGLGTQMYLPGSTQSITLPDKSFMSTQSGLVLSGMTDDNAVPNRVGRFGSEATTGVTPLMWEEFEGTTLNAQRWTATNTTFAPAQSAQGYSINPTYLGTASAVSVLLSVKQYIRFARAPLHYRTRCRVSNYTGTQNNFGFADTVSGVTQITNGAYFQLGPTGRIQGVVTIAGTDIATDVSFGSHIYSADNTYVWDILVDDDSVLFLVQDTSTGKIVGRCEVVLTSCGARMFSSTHLRVFHRGFNLAIVPPRTLIHVIQYSFLGVLDSQLGKSWDEIIAFNTTGSIALPTTLAQAQAYANSAEPASATLSNTTATYTTSVLGGKFQFAAVAGAATDYIIFGFTAPAPYSLIVKAVTIDVWNTGAANSASVPTCMSWGCHVNAPALTLASNSIRRFIGNTQIPVSAAIGATATTRIYKQFTTPLVTESGRFFDICVRIPVGAATASQVIAGAVDIDGYFE